jgi:antitoxin component of MazEF toxin-antitoxin module
VKRTIVHEQPLADSIVILHPHNMKRLKINTYDYINLKNTVYSSHDVNNRSKELEISARAIGNEHYLSRILTEDGDEYPNDESVLGKREIAVDQICREALALKVGCEVTLSKTDRKYGIGEKLLTRLDYQKAVVRVQGNESYFERKTPVVCLCEEIMKAIDVDYGDNIEVEHMDKRIIVKCAKLTENMKNFHDHVLSPSLKPKGQETEKQQSYLLYPEDFGIESEFSGAEMIHPVFMDRIARDLLGVKALDPVKIRKYFKWQVLKTVNKLGSVSAPFAIPVLIGFVGVQTVSDFWRNVDYVGIILLASWLTWSVATSSTYRVSSPPGG